MAREELGGAKKTLCVSESDGDTVMKSVGRIRVVED
jgi:hypothetical protein